MENEPSFCSYCGDYDESRDHVIPQRYTSVISDGSGSTVPCCSMCNTLAGSVYVTAIFEKAFYLERQYINHYSRYLYSGARWTDEELAELDYTLRSHIWKCEYMKRFISFKLENLQRVQNGYSPVPFREQHSESFSQDISDLKCEKSR